MRLVLSSRGRLRATPPFTYDNSNVASHSVEMPAVYLCVTEMGA